MRSSQSLQIVRGEISGVKVEGAVCHLVMHENDMVMIMIMIEMIGEANQS